jgi:formylglycine-generating enzyme required for sulfatase activity
LSNQTDQEETTRARAVDAGKQGDAYRAQGQLEKAIELYEQALAFTREIGDRRSEGAWLGRMASTYGDLGQIWQASELYEQALAIAREMGDRRSESTWLAFLGVDLLNQRQVSRSIEYLTQALAIAREIGDRRIEGIWLGNMANAYDAQGQKEKASEMHEQAVAITREAGDRYHEGLWLSNLGVIYRELGQPEKAVESCRRALTIAREIGDRQMESRLSGSLDRALGDLQQMKKIDPRERRHNEGKRQRLLAMAYHAQGQLEKAIGAYEQALVLAHLTGDSKAKGSLLAALDRAQKALGEAAEAAPVAAPPKIDPTPAPQREAPVEPQPEPFAITSPIHLELIRVPGGEFLMGSLSEEYKQRDERPQHSIHVPEFCIGKYPVTNEQYAVFLQATGHKAPWHWKEGEMPAGKKNHPAMHVTWYDAAAFCEWLCRETGKSFALPSEAEWEKAARGTDGRLYPWGDEYDKDKCNTFESRVLNTTPVGWYSPAGDSPYGCVDMAGNVYEWTRSLKEEYPYDPDDGREELGAGDRRVLRGGCFMINSDGARCAARMDWGTDDCGWKTGLRVVFYETAR